ncbi:MAG: beta-N-acetylhexosaminidase, partial [Alistipes sp.]|nr:beta-N-acetylhexosaminidase [Alistipes sp.]
MIRTLASLILLLGAWSAGTWSASGQNLVPLPVSVERGEGVALQQPYPAVEATHPTLAPLREYLCDNLPAGRVKLTLDGAESLPAEGYRLSVAPGLVTIAGRDYGGVWNGIQTLLQLFPVDVYSDVPTRRGLSLPLLTIEDWPAMEYRGVMLDVARTFVPLERVMKLIDDISRHKINKFHWHLADDEGWRVEIKGLPELTATGAWRGGGSSLWAVYGSWEEKYGGFYTQEEIRQVVAYAALRNVEVIPEIDLPGHSRAAAIAYPEILCDYTPSPTASAGYDVRNVFCVAREENYAIVDTIIGELAELFPSETFHIGGDEVMTGQWRQCPHCAALMTRRGITDVARLQDVFMERTIEIAAHHGKRSGVWNEAAESGRIPRSATVWAWENPASGARKFASAGFPTVVSSGEYFYFDQRQSARDIGHIWAGIVTLEKVYSFSPAAVGFTASEAAGVRGVEATLFMELGLENGPGYIDHQLFPRVCALAEVGWTPAERRSWSDFENRLTWRSAGAPSHLDRLTAMGLEYRAAEPAIPALPPLKTPAVAFTSSLPESTREPFARVAAYRAGARMTRAPIEGDWFRWDFAEGLPYDSYREIEIKTGYDHLQRAGVPGGRIEVSYDGRSFSEIARLDGLKATLVLAGEMENHEPMGPGRYVLPRSTQPIR